MWCLPQQSHSKGGSPGTCPESLHLLCFTRPDVSAIRHSQLHNKLCQNPTLSFILLSVPKLLHACCHFITLLLSLGILFTKLCFIVFLPPVTLPILTLEKQQNTACLYFSHDINSCLLYPHMLILHISWHELPLTIHTLCRTSIILCHFLLPVIWISS